MAFPPFMAWFPEALVPSLEDQLQSLGLQVSRVENDEFLKSQGVFGKYDIRYWKVGWEGEEISLFFKRAKDKSCWWLSIFSLGSSTRSFWPIYSLIHYFLAAGAKPCWGTPPITQMFHCTKELHDKIFEILKSSDHQLASFQIFGPFSRALVTSRRNRVVITKGPYLDPQNSDKRCFIALNSIRRLSRLLSRKPSPLYLEIVTMIESHGGTPFDIFPYVDRVPMTDAMT